MDDWLWRRMRRRLDRAVPDERSAAVIGDLQEDYTRRRTVLGAVRARLWLWRETRSLERAYRHTGATRAWRRRPGAGLLLDVRFAIRRIRSAPAFSIFAVLTLARGIGATTAIYSVIRAALSPPSGVATLDRLVTITHSASGSVPMIALSYGDFQDLRARQTAFQDVAGWTYLRISYGAGGETGSSWGERVTGDYFQVLGVRAALGRTLQPADDDPAAAPVAVISHGVWQRVFGGVPDVIGRLMKVNGLTVEIVGVVPRAFAGLFNSGLVPTAVWMPLGSSRTMPGARDDDLADRSSRWIQVRARLKDGVTFEAARADVTRIAQQLDQAIPLPAESADRRSYRENRPWVVRRTADTSLNEGADGVASSMAATVMGAVGLVLLVACTNLANLMLARGSGRREETAIRLALGASRGRLIRGELVESLILAGIGGLIGLVVARVVLVLVGTDLPVGNSTSIRFLPRLDPSVLAISAGATSLAVLVAGLLPALQSTRTDVRSAMASGTAAALPRWRGRRMLIAAQVTVSVILVTIAGLCLQQIRELSRSDLGLDLDRVALVEVDFAIQQYPESRVRAITETVLTDLTRRPGVGAAFVSSGLPIGVGTPGTDVGDTSHLTHWAELVASSPGIFETLGVGILKGRALNESDTAGSAPVAVISAFTAKALFGTVEAVGRSLFLQRTRWAGESPHPLHARTVVGVVTDATADRTDPDRGGIVYVPLTQHYEGRLVIGARTSDDPASLVPVVRQTLAAADPTIAVAQAGTGMTIAGPSSLFLQITAGLTGVLGGFALALALAGLYGALSHVIHRRRREMGLRMALGANRPDILRLVLRDGLRPVISGIVLGLVFGGMVRLGLTPLFDRLLPTLDPFVLTVVPLLLLACGVLACLIPARRASNVDPNLALRDL